jgi:protein ImuA
MTEQLRQRFLALQRISGITDSPGTLPLGIAAIDTVLGGGFLRGALHEIAAPGESHFTAAAGFALGVASTSLWQSPSTPLTEEISEDVDARYRTGHDGRGNTIVWIAEDMALAESGAPHGAGLDTFGLAPERLVTVSVAHRRDLLWAMEETLRCRTINTVIGEMRVGRLDGTAVRRLSLAAAKSGAVALLLRAVPPIDASTAATRWIVGAAPSAFTHGPGTPRFAAQLVRNRRGPTGLWILEWSDSDEQFLLATHAQPVAAPVLNGPYRQIA